MANTPISGFPSGAPAQSGDQFVIARAGANYNLLASDMKTLIIGAGSVSIATGKTFTASNTLTFAGTDGSTLNIGTGGTLGGLATVTPGTGVATAAANAVNATGGFITYATYAPASGKTLTVSNSLTIAGTDSTTMTFPTTSATIARTDAGQTFTGNQVVSSGSFSLSGNISAPAWTTNGIRYANVGATLTDTTSSGTVATAYTDVFGGNTIAASSATTFTNYYTTFISPAASGTNVTFTNRWALGLGGALQISGQSLSGSQSQSLVDLATTWNTTGAPTAIKLNVTNTASAAGSLLMDLQDSSSPRFSFRKDGQFILSGTGNGIVAYGNSNARLDFNAAYWGVNVYGSQAAFGLGAGSVPDTFLRSDSAGVLALRNGANAQEFRVYNTWTSATNFEAYDIDWKTTSNLCLVGPSKGSGGGTQRVQRLQYLEDGGTGSTEPSLGTTCPAASATIKSWIKVVTSDGTTGYIPCWA